MKTKVLLFGVATIAAVVQVRAFELVGEKSEAEIVIPSAAAVREEDHGTRVEDRD